MRHGIHRIGRRVVMIVTLSLLGGLVSATLVRFAPGYGIDERELDPRLNHASLEVIRSSHRLNSNLLSYYGNYLWGAVHGNFGTSEWLQRPISWLGRPLSQPPLRASSSAASSLTSRALLSAVC